DRVDAGAHIECPDRRRQQSPRPPQACLLRCRVTQQNRDAAEQEIQKSRDQKTVRRNQKRRRQHEQGIAHVVKRAVAGSVHETVPVDEVQGDALIRKLVAYRRDWHGNDDSGPQKYSPGKDRRQKKVFAVAGRCVCEMHVQLCMIARMSKNDADYGEGFHGTAGKRKKWAANMISTMPITVVRLPRFLTA